VIFVVFAPLTARAGVALSARMALCVENFTIAAGQPRYPAGVVAATVSVKALGFSIPPMLLATADEAIA